MTLSAAAWANDVDNAAYSVLTGVAGTNTITATGPANYAYGATKHPLFFISAVTNTGPVTINITPSGGAALGTRAINAYGSALVGGELIAGLPVALIDDGTRFNILGTFNNTASWTPSDGSGAALTFTSVSAVYTKFGNTIHATATLTYPATADGSAAKIAGLPIAQSATAGARAGSITFSQTASAVYCTTQTGSAVMQILTGIGGATTNAQMSGLTISVEATYQI